LRFSEFYKLNKTQAYLDFVDIDLETDLAIFIDPVSLKSLKTPWGAEISYFLKHYFTAVLDCIKSGKDDEAKHLLTGLSESNEFHLGYSAQKSRGHAFGTKSAALVWKALTQSKAAKSGLLEDLEDTALLIHGIGPDMISDAICNIIRGPLIKYTQDMCKYYDVPLEPNIPSGLIWDVDSSNWRQEQVQLPVAGKYGKVLLIPKLLARHRMNVDAGGFYTHYILPAMQQEHLLNKSALVQNLKNGSVIVTKKSLREKYGETKLNIVDQTVIRPEIFKEYKNEKNSKPSPPITSESFAKLENQKLPDVAELSKQLREIPTGRESSKIYEDKIEEILTYIFYPSLCKPSREQAIHNHRKRVDIRYHNEARVGFFKWLSDHYTCPYIFVECKNYGKEVGNPEVDQLSGRFGPSRGKVGLLVCRSIENKKSLMNRCRDTCTDDRGYIIALDDDDIIRLLEENDNNKRSQSFVSLNKLWGNLIN
tara:strand:+ start:6676 stop:8112 length:1437 start_codon:yes stop_codon:yes gene_type:complete